MKTVKVGDTINYVRIEVAINGKIITDIEKYKVILSNGKKFVINDNNFSTFNHEYQGKYSSCLDLDRPSANECNWHCSSITDYVYGSCYSKSSQRVLFNKVKKKIEKFINDKHGRYGLLSNIMLGVTFPEQQKETE